MVQVGKELPLPLSMPLEDYVGADGDNRGDWGSSASCCTDGGVGVDRCVITSSGYSLGSV